LPEASVGRGVIALATIMSSLWDFEKNQPAPPGLGCTPNICYKQETPRAAKKRERCLGVSIIFCNLPLRKNAFVPPDYRWTLFIEKLSLITGCI